MGIKVSAKAVLLVTLSESYLKFITLYKKWFSSFLFLLTFLYFWYKNKNLLNSAFNFKFLKWLLFKMRKTKEFEFRKIYAKNYYKIFYFSKTNYLETKKNIWQRNNWNFDKCRKVFANHLFTYVFSIKGKCFNEMESTFLRNFLYVMLEIVFQSFPCDSHA